MSLIIKIFVEPTGKAPTLGNPGDAGIDCYSDCSAGNFTLEVGQTAKIPLGFHYAFFRHLDPQGLLRSAHARIGIDNSSQIIPTDDYYIQIANRSGFGYKECVTELSTICDASYKGIPHYCIAKVAGTTTTVQHHQKVCQALIHPFIDPHTVKFEYVSSLEELGTTTRGSNGFNSSGSF